MKSCDDMVKSLLERKKQYENMKKKRKKVVLSAIVPLCCICFITLIGLGIWQGGLFKYKISASSEIDNSSISVENYSEALTLTSTGESSTSLGISSETLAVASDNVLIFYVDGNELLSEQKYLKLYTKEIFNAWKEKNNIGEDVELIKYSIDSNSTTSAMENNGSTTLQHTVGNRFVLNITLSKSIENYYDTINPKLLLDSLKQTMTGYHHITFDEYNLILE